MQRGSRGRASNLTQTPRKMAFDVLVLAFKNIPLKCTSPYFRLYAVIYAIVLIILEQDKIQPKIELQANICQKCLTEEETQYLLFLLILPAPAQSDSL